MSNVVGYYVVRVNGQSVYAFFPTYAQAARFLLPGVGRYDQEFYLIEKFAE